MALTKITNITYQAGTPGTAGDPGEPPSPGYWQEVTTGGGVGTWIVIDLGYDIPGTGTPARQTIYIAPPPLVTTRTWVPPTPGRPGTPGTPGTPSTTREDFNLGWNAGAISIAVQPADFIYTVEVLPSSVGVFTGVNYSNEGNDYREINYGFYFNQGKALVYEDGIQKSAAFALAVGDEFSVLRSGTAVTYLKNGSQIFASSTPSYGTMFADASLYCGGDVITAASFAAVVGVPLTGTAAGVGRAVPSPKVLNGAARGAGSTSAWVRINGRVDLFANTTGVGTASGTVTRNASLSGTSNGTADASATMSNNAANSVLQALTGIASDYIYSSSIGGFSALSGTASNGEIVPQYALASAVLQPMLGVSRMMTGEVISSGASLPALTGLSANRPYAASRGVLSALTGDAVDFPLIDGSAYLRTPLITFVGLGHDSTGENALNRTLPKLTMRAFSGASAKLKTPVIGLSIQGLVTNWGEAEITTPALTCLGSGVFGSIGSAEMVFGGNYALSGYGGAVLSATIGGVTLQASSTSGSIGKAAVELPMFELEASAVAENYGSARLVTPAFGLVPTGQSWLTLPGFQLTAIGTAVVTASYEAYAINLLRSVDRNPNNNYIAALDEVTHYTNYPFTHVVRYQGSYYGANSTGLYLLEGTTDDGVAIPFAVKTAVTDFKTPNKKTLAAAYFSGRFGPASTISLHEGEKTPNTYSFTTPRGTLAQNHRQKFGKGTKGRYFALSVTGTGTCELDGIEPEVHQLTRRI